MKITSENVKVDMGVAPAALNNSNTTGKYVKMQKYRELMAVLHVSSMAASKTAKLELLEAKDASGTDAQAIDDADCTITANTSVYKATVACDTVIATDVLTVNGNSYTVVSSGATLADGEVNVGGTDTAMAAAFATAINDSDYGVDGVTASSSSGTLTLESTDGETAITVSTPDSTMTIATSEAWCYVWMKANDLSVSDGFRWVAPKVTVTSNSVVSVSLLRGDPRYSIVQGAAASATL